MRPTKDLARLAAAVLCAVALCPPAVSGQSLFEPGARAAGMGGAFVALSDDTSALFYNPAGLVGLPGVRAKANLVLGAPTTEVSIPGRGAIQSQPFIFRGSLAISWRFWKRASLGLGFHTPYGLKSEWPSSWPGDDVSLAANYSPTYFRAAVSVELLPGLSVGAGLDYIQAELTWNRSTLLPFSPRIARDITSESRHELSGSGTDYAAGLMWKVHRTIQVGLCYRSGEDIELSGRNIFVTPNTQLVGVRVPGPYGGTVTLVDVLRAFYESQDVTGRFALPAQMAVGIRLVPISRLSLLLDAQQIQWRGFGSWEVRSESEESELSPGFNQDYRKFYGIAPDYGVQSAGLKFRDVWDIKAGLEFRPSPHLAVRSGFTRHTGSSETAALNPVYPDLSQNIVSLGAGYEGPLFSVYDNRQVSELSFDVYLRYGFSGEGTSALAGHEFAYTPRGWVGGVGVGFNF